MFNIRNRWFNYLFKARLINSIDWFLFLNDKTICYYQLPPNASVANSSKDYLDILKIKF